MNLNSFLYTGFESGEPWLHNPHRIQEYTTGLFPGSVVPSVTPPRPGHFSVTFLVAAVSSKVAAANMTDKTAAEQIIAAADQAISAFIDSDDICPRWPYPGPPPWLSIMASELTFVANTFQEGSLRTGILQVAGRVLHRVALNPQPLPP